MSDYEIEQLNDLFHVVQNSKSLNTDDGVDLSAPLVAAIIRFCVEAFSEIGEHQVPGPGPKRMLVHHSGSGDHAPQSFCRLCEAKESLKELIQ